MGKVKNRDWMEMLEAEDRPSASSSWRRTISVTGHWMGWSTRQRSCRYVVEPRRRVRRLATGNRAGEEARNRESIWLKVVILWRGMKRCVQI
ncbi:uncharacterized protein [Triticum aestivum]|uniref:uncharacterized protein isoform X2 n=1 Tax=Triticum aestivum TaxID=4565 RepID=UPI001D019E86|nr:uncharacterized protein LOC123046781 isoform X2 [Triticum aestivum]